MWSFSVVVIDPWLEVGVSLLGVGPVFGIGPFAQGGLDKAFGFPIGSRCVGPGALVLDGHLQAWRN